MLIPRWFLVSMCLLLLNLGWVVATVVNRRVYADGPQVSSLDNTEQPPAEVQAAAGDDLSVSVASKKPPAEDPHQPASDDPLSQLVVPEELPAVPSLTDPEALKNDPVFQEFRKLFADQEEKDDRWLSSGLDMGRLPAKPNGAYFSALDRRLATVENLCTAARQIAAEAADFASDGNSERSQELLQMATQLRDMAANLLVDKL